MKETIKFSLLVLVLILLSVYVFYLVTVLSPETSLFAPK